LLSGTQGETVDASFVSLRTGQPLRIRFSTDNEVVIATPDMDLAGDLVQDLALFMSLRDVASTAEFPEELATFEEVVRRVDEYNATRQRLSADMAESAAGVSMLAVRAEEARIRTDMCVAALRGGRRDWRV
jgi:Bardet-Biedl syndrome 2 protein